jgi:hypothetical protein
MASYDLGDVVRLTGTFTNSAGAAADPTTVTFSYTDPNGTTTTLVYLTDAALVKDSTGVYHVDIAASIEGIWRWRWLSTGTGAASTEGQFAVVRTTVRAGMQNLINRVRALTGAGVAEYTIGDISYWTDEHIQSTLDGSVRYFVAAPLVWKPEQIAGTVNYLIAQAPYRDLEEAASGTARWAVRDGAGAFIGTANYTPNYRTGEISFGTVNQGGTAYYLTAYSYDVCAAAADVLQGRLVNFNSYFDFSADNQSFSRSQIRKNIREMIDDLRGCIGENVIGAVSGDMHTSEFVRVDINTSGWGWM